MRTLSLFRMDDEEMVPVGRLTVGPKGVLTPDGVTDPVLVEVLKDLTVSSSLRGEPVSTEDPDYALAVADSIGYETSWRYVAEPQ